MKTDRFADSIRRKLDSIRPEFSERDWVNMQAMLKQAGPLPNATPMRPRLFSGKAARLVAAGAAGTVLFLGTTLYQTYELNRLRNSTQQAGQPTSQVDSVRTITTDTPMATRTDTPTALPETSATSKQASPPVIRDTVYIDRYIRVPATPERTERVAHTPGQPVGEMANQEPIVADRLSRSARRATSPERPSDAPFTDAPIAGATPGAVPANPTSGSKAQNAAGDAQSGAGVAATSRRTQPVFPADLSVANRSGNRTESISGGRTRLGASRETGTAGTTGTTRPGNAGGNGTTGTNPTASDESAGNSNGQAVARTESYGPTSTSTDPVISAGNDATGSSAIRAELIQIQPVQLGTVAWEQRLMLRSRRMHPARTVVVGGTAVARASDTKSAPEKPERQSVSSLVKLRVGAGSDLNGKLWSVGGFAELLAGRHITFSVGLSKASFNNGDYTTEDDFVRQNRTDFRREFDVRQNLKYIDARNDIISIQLQTVRLVMPVTLGYRIPINSALAITPTVGTILNLQSEEKVSFIVRQFPVVPQYMSGPEYRAASFRTPRQSPLVNNVTLGATVEWQRKHWGVQAGPILSLTSQPDPDWVSSLSGGIRARAFFQF